MSTETRVFPRHAKGARPSFFDDPAIDQVMTFVIEVTTELSVLRDRVNTLESLLEKHELLPAGAVENFRPDPEAERSRMAARKAFLERVFRMHDLDGALHIAELGDGSAL